MAAMVAAKLALAATPITIQKSRFMFYETKRRGNHCTSTLRNRSVLDLAGKAGFAALGHRSALLTLQQVIDQVDKTLLIAGAVAAISQSSSDHGFGPLFDKEGDGCAANATGLGITVRLAKGHGLGVCEDVLQ